MGEVAYGGVVDPPTPKHTAKHLSVIDLSVLEQHSPIVLQSSLEEVPRIYFLFSADHTQSTRSPLLIYVSDVNRVSAAL